MQCNTASSHVILKKMAVTQLLKKFPTWMLFPVFTWSQQCTLPAAISNCPNPQNLTEVIFLLQTLSIIHLECSNVKLCLNINSIHNIIRTSTPVSLQVSHTFLISLTYATCNIHHFSESDHPLTWQQVNKTKLYSIINMGYVLSMSMLHWTHFEHYQCFLSMQIINIKISD